MKQIVVLIFVMIAFTKLQAQDSTKTIASILEEKRYSFVPQTITPMSGGTRQVTGGFSLDVKGDSLVVYLPYMGRAFTAPVNPNDAGYNFTSANYDYAVKEGRRNQYIVTMKVKDKFSGTQFYLTVYDNNNALLQANSSDKQTISYNGYIKQIK